MIHEKNHLNKPGGRADKGAKSNSPAAMFEKVLRAFEIGDLTFADLQATLKRQLADGAAPDELLKILRRRELIEPLPEYAHEEILGVLEAKMQASTARDGTAAPAAAPIPEPSAAEQHAAPTVIRMPSPDADSDETAISRLIQALAADWDPEPAVGTGAAAAATALDSEYKAMRVALSERDDDLVALRAEHARVLGLLEARARSAAQLEGDLHGLAAELEATRNALQLQQSKTREIDDALNKRIADEEAARARSEDVAVRSEQALRSAEIYQMELNALHESVAARDSVIDEARRLLAERDAALDQMRRALAERDAQVAALHESLAARDAALDQMRRALAERDAQVAALHESLAARDAALDQTRRALAERDAQMAALQQEHAQMAPTIESRAQSAAKLQADLLAAQTRGAALEADLAAARTALAAEQGKSRQLDGALAEKNALNGKTLSLQHSLDERNTQLAALKQEHSKISAAFMARAKTLESELQGARRRIDTLSSELKKSRDSAAAPAAQRAAAESPRPAVAAASAPAPASTPAPALEAKGGVEIAEFAPPPRARRWTRATIVRAMGACAVVAAVAIGVWIFAHHAPSTKVSEVSAAPVPAPAPGAVIRDCPTCPAFTVLPAGRFKQGSAESSSSASIKPLHWVAISQPFAMSTNAVTMAEFGAFIAATGRDMQGCDTYDGQWKHQQGNDWRNPGFEQTGAHPVTCASWSDAKAYAQWLSAKTGHGYRLPSASEWEYAARAGGSAVQPWSTNGSDACLNANVADISAARRYPGWVAFACNDGYVYTAPVGSFKASAFGLNDMLGNVLQWTEDCWSANYVGAPVDGSARRDGNCAEHELRGGSWFSSPDYVRADYRNHFAADYRASSVGIRLVRDIAP